MDRFLYRCKKVALGNKVSCSNGPHPMETIYLGLVLLLVGPTKSLHNHLN